jgi:DNA adenine methylase
MPVARNNHKVIRPFLKWAGGKTQLLQKIAMSLPAELKKVSSFTYVEPFVGSGAVFLFMLREFPNIKKAVINDMNSELVSAWETIRDKPGELICQLKELTDSYHKLGSEEARKEMFLKIREQYNRKTSNKPAQSACLIFLNKTCYNGLYRVNLKNLFNVPFGKHKNPKIFDEKNIYEISRLISHTEIMNGDFEETLVHTGKPAFFYFDPPYKPLSSTSVFNSYSSQNFDDREQIRLKNFCDELNKQKIPWLLSNSDVKDMSSGGDFFDNLYNEYHITRVNASRLINSNISSRGKISELLISNYRLKP